MYHNNIIEWLEMFIKSRLDLKINLEQVEDRTLIHLENDKRIISIVNNSSLFLGRDLPFCYFDISSFMSDYPILPLIPMPGLNFPVKDLMEVSNYNNDVLNVNYDILGLIYWSLNRIEEIDSQETDGHDRFIASQSHAAIYGYLDRPWVDEWVMVLERIFTIAWPSVKTLSHKFSISPSHDVDIPSKYAFIKTQDFARQFAKDILKGSKNVLKPLKIRYYSKMKLDPSDSFNTFNYLMDQSENRGLKSTFFFMVNVSNPAMDSGYSLAFPAIENLLKEIAARGHEIGIHPSYETYMNPKLFKQETDKLIDKCHDLGIEQPEWGGRMHFLRWQHPVTLRGFVAAGLSYDATLGYANIAGFRCGTCHPYKAFDHINLEMLSLTLKPLIAMDVSLRGRNYMNLSNEAAIAYLSLLKERCKAVSGDFSVLWHNSQFEDEGSYTIYESALDN